MNKFGTGPQRLSKLLKYGFCFVYMKMRNDSLRCLNLRHKYLTDISNGVKVFVVQRVICYKIQVSLCFPIAKGRRRFYLIFQKRSGRGSIN
jgi:hypothetical protein